MVRKRCAGGQWAVAALAWLSVALVAGAAELEPPAATTSSEKPASTNLDAALFDRYTGNFLLGTSRVLAVTRESNRLFAQLTGEPKAEIFAQSEHEFFYKVIDAQITFQTDIQGRTTGLVLHQNGAHWSAPRIDDAAAHRISAAINAKIQSQTATPGSDAALRRFIAGIIDGKPIAGMSPELRDVTLRQLPQLQAAMVQLGAVQSIEFRGVNTLGWDLYEVQQEKGTSRWSIALGSDGIITGALASTAR